MAEDLCISNGGKEEKYRMLLPQIKCLIEGEDDLIANLANVAAALKETFHFFWVGFYLVKGEDLVLAPFQGPVACTRIKKGRGVCGKAWKRAEISDIVLPLLRAKGEVWGVLDVDSENLNSFDEVDARFLQELCSYL